MIKALHGQQGSPDPAGNSTTRSRPAFGRVFWLVLLGAVLSVAAIWVRLSRPVRDTMLRGKEIPELEAAVRERPADPLPRYYLAKKYYLQRRFVEAHDAYAEVARLEPGNARAHLGLGLASYELGHNREARDEFEKTRSLDPSSAWAEYMLGTLNWFAGNVGESLPHVRRAADLDPRSDPAWYGMAVCLIQLKRYEEAIDALKKAIGQNSAIPRYHTALGELLVYRGHTLEGRKEYERALELDPNYGPACGLMGSFLLHKATEPEAFERARELLERATRLKAYHPEQVYLDLGQLYIQDGQFQKSILALKTSIRLEPRDERPYYALANAYRRLGKKSEAAEAEQRFKQVSERHVQMQTLEARVFHDPRSPEARLRLARLYKDLGLNQQAAQQYIALLGLDPENRDAPRELEQVSGRYAATPLRDADPASLLSRLR